MSTLGQLRHQPKYLTIRQLAATMLLQFDGIVLGILPVIVIVIGLSYLSGLTNYRSAHDLALWYAPWHIYTGYFCTPLGYLTSLVPPVLTIVAVSRVQIGNQKSWGVLLLVIFLHSVIAVLGLMVHSYYAGANDATEWFVTYNLYTQTRLLFAGAIILINLMTIALFGMWKRDPS